MISCNEVRAVYNAIKSIKLINMATIKNNKGQSIILANSDVVYLWWTYPQKIKNCLGFSIHRIINGVEDKKGLYATVGFSIVNDPRKSPQTTDQWPIQSFNWKDLYAPHEKEIAYKIIPMIDTKNDWKCLTPDETLSIETETVNRTQKYGVFEIIFNRGLLSTQAFSEIERKGLNKEDLISEAKGLISEPNSEWRKRLGGQIISNIRSFFGQKGKFYCALYELSDQELIEILVNSQNAEIILSSSDSNVQSRKILHDAMESEILKIYDRNMTSNSIGHNKFVVYVNENGVPISVLTGSTNWTPTGLCGQTNNLVRIENEKVAKLYLEYWTKLRADTINGTARQDLKLRTWCKTNGAKIQLKKPYEIDIWFSPNTDKKTKPKVITPEAIPVDMNEVFDLIKGAKKQLLFLLFNPGTPSIVDYIVKSAIEAKSHGKPIFVRGAVSDAQMAKKVTTNIISKDATLPPDKYQVTGVAAIPGKFSYWETELLKLGFATIHDKVLVIDPFDEINCVVVTGSHNLGLKASYSNDENMVIIKGNSSVAKAYSAHILDVVNHFKWRYRLQEKVKGVEKGLIEETLKNTWHDLDETDEWMDYYYKSNGDLMREQLLFK
jgi:phosphatidylserine/phosphatidylglycerophosphate/cardiolipin synthase-like enzyme